MSGSEPSADGADHVDPLEGSGEVLPDVELPLDASDSEATLEGELPPAGDPSTEGTGTSKQPSPDDDDDEGIPSRKLLVWGLLLTACYLAITVADVVWAANRVTDVSAPAAVVLGAAQYNGEPSEALRRRLDRAAELYESNRVELVVVTGGRQEEDITTEAKSGYDYLRETAGMPDDDLRLEVQGGSTYESLAAVERFLEAEGIGEVILVTDPYHARRSQLVADEVGLEASVYPTEGSLPVDRIITESAAVAAGRVIGFRRLNNYLVG